MMLSPDGAPALPLWINGRAFLTLTAAFYDVHDAQSGAVLRRTPLCGASEVAEALASAQTAAPAWAAMPAAQRQALLDDWAAALAAYAGHFAGLIRAETGKSAEAAAAEVAAAIASLRAGPASPATPAAAGATFALAWDDSAPLAHATRLSAPLLCAGGTVVFKPTPKAPAAAFALAELSARAGLPAGVVNLVQGDEAALAALLAHADVRQLAFAGRAPLAERIRTLAQAAGKPLDLHILPDA
jgi:acyl-CoA reductase-like NAD-dependent aldehyde dehydrogenase